MLVFTDTKWVKKFAEFALSGTVFEIQAFLCFAIFVKNSKWPPFLKIGSATQQSYPMDQIFVEIALSSTVFEIQAFLCFAIFAKNSKIENSRHFWASEIFVETWKG